MATTSNAAPAHGERTNRERLARLSNTGTRVEDGRLINLFHKPSPFAAPPEATDGQRTEKKPFTVADSAVLFDLLDAAEEEGVTGSAPFQYLQSMRPKHSWQSYENHYRKSKAPATLRSIMPYKAAFPNLVRPGQPATIAVGRPDEDQDTAGGEGGWGRCSNVDVDGDVKYSDLRVSSIRSVLRCLGLFSVDELHELIQLPSIIGAYVEYREAMFQRPSEAADDRADDHADDATPARPAQAGHSPHRWKISHAQLMAETRAPRFTRSDGSLNPDKSGWSADDHDIRFIVRLYLDTVAGKTPWSHLLGLAHRYQLCERINWLLAWFRFLHTPTRGASPESLRVQQRKDEFRRMLPPGPAPPVHSSLDAAAAESGARVPTPQERLVGYESPSSDGPRTVRGTSRPDEEAAAAPSPRRPPFGGASSPEQPSPRSAATPSGATLAPSSMALGGVGLSWLSQEAWQVFQNQQTLRLASWGVNRRHAGTCVLVPDVWVEQNPRDLLGTLGTEDLPVNANLEKRLHFHLYDVTVTWARAAVWFNQSRRTPEDLALFNSSKGAKEKKKKDAPSMHASHLCHQGFCINPNHLIYESRDSNFSRTLCMYTARGFRALGKLEHLPSQCTAHPDAPCMLHHAALTIAEAVSLQLDVLKKALGGESEGPPSASGLAAPPSHPAYYGTFESRFPLTVPLAAVRYSEENLTEPPYSLSLAPHVTTEKFTISCRFCPNARRRWQRITAFWSHLRIQHAEQAHEELLEAMRKSAVEYKAWADRRFYDLSRQNPVTWQKMEQIGSEGFCWEVVQGWRLPQDRLYEGRSSPHTPGTPGDAE